MSFRLEEQYARMLDMIKNYLHVSVSTMMRNALNKLIPEILADQSEHDRNEILYMCEHSSNKDLVEKIRKRYNSIINERSKIENLSTATTASSASAISTSTSANSSNDDIANKKMSLLNIDLNDSNVTSKLDFTPQQIEFLRDLQKLIRNPTTATTTTATTNTNTNPPWIIGKDKNNSNTAKLTKAEMLEKAHGKTGNQSTQHRNG